MLRSLCLNSEKRQQFSFRLPLVRDASFSLPCMKNKASRLRLSGGRFNKKQAITGRQRQIDRYVDRQMRRQIDRFTDF